MKAAPRFFDLSARTKLCVTGVDRIRFLNGQTTNDVRKANAEATEESCVLNAKGHLDAHIFVFATPNEIWIDADERLREQLPARLERYIIADDVKVEDATQRFLLFHVLTQSKPAGVTGKFWLKSRRLGSDGWDFWVEAERRAEVMDQFGNAYQPADENDWELLRIESGIPRWGRELTADVIPPEANLAERGIDYEKGCYIGQEVISRMKMSGQLRQRLCGLISDKQLFPGMQLHHDTKMVGRVTSAIFSAAMNSNIALAMIKRGYNDVGMSLLARGEDIQGNVQVMPLPFATRAPSSGA